MVWLSFFVVDSKTLFGIFPPSINLNIPEPLHNSGKQYYSPLALGLLNILKKLTKSGQELPNFPETFISLILKNGVYFKHKLAMKVFPRPLRIIHSGINWVLYRIFQKTPFLKRTAGDVNQSGLRLSYA